MLTNEDRQSLIDALRHPETVVGLAMKATLIQVLEENAVLVARLEKVERALGIATGITIGITIQMGPTPSEYVPVPVYIER